MTSVTSSKVIRPGRFNAPPSANNSASKTSAPPKDRSEDGRGSAAKNDYGVEKIEKKKKGDS
jgi:hypothetical protein